MLSRLSSCQEITRSCARSSSVCCLCSLQELVKCEPGSFNLCLRKRCFAAIPCRSATKQRSRKTCSLKVAVFNNLFKIIIYSLLSYVWFACSSLNWFVCILRRSSVKFCFLWNGQPALELRVPLVKLLFLLWHCWGYVLLNSSNFLSNLWMPTLRLHYAHILPIHERPISQSVYR